MGELLPSPTVESPPPARILTAEQVVRILEGIRDIYAEATLDGQLTCIAKVTTELAGCERCSVFLVDAEKGELWSKVATGLTDQEIRFRVGRGIAGTVAETAVLENIPDAYADPRFNQDVDRQTGFRTRNMLVVPVSNRRGIVVGVLQLINKQAGTFAPSDEALITVFGAQVAIAIENVQRLEELRTNDIQLKEAFLAAEQKEQQRQERRGRLRFLRLAFLSTGLLAAIGVALWSSGVRIPFLSGETSTVAELVAEQQLGAVIEEAPIRQVHTVTLDSLSAKIVQTGNAEPALTRAIVASVPGVVLEVLVREGQRVDKGHPLIRLDDREIRARLPVATANLLRAQGQLQSLDQWSRSPEMSQARRGVQLARMALEEGRSKYEVTQRLFERGIASRDELETNERTFERLKLEHQAAEENQRTMQDRVNDTERAVAQAQLKNAQAELEEIQRQLSLTTIVAPFNGLVMPPEGAEGRRLRLPEVGDSAQPGIPLLLLGDTGQLRVRLQLDEVDADKVRVGQKARARMDVFPGAVLEGRVDFVSPIARIVEKSAFFDTIVTITKIPEDIRGRVRLGMSATIEIVTADRQNVVAIPIQAVARDGGETFVNLVDRSQAAPVRQRLAVKLGVSTAKLVEVLEGLQEGDEIALP